MDEHTSIVIKQMCGGQLTPEMQQVYAQAKHALDRASAGAKFRPSELALLVGLAKHFGNGQGKVGAAISAETNGSSSETLNSVEKEETLSSGHFSKEAFNRERDRPPVTANYEFEPKDVSTIQPEMNWKKVPRLTPVVIRTKTGDVNGKFHQPGRLGKIRVQIEGDEKAYREVDPDDVTIIGYQTGPSIGEVPDLDEE